MPFDRLHWLVFALCLAGAACARAEGADDLQFRAAIGLMHDSNLFRLPANANTQALIGKSSPADTIGIGTLGVNYNKAYSLQRVELDASVTDYRYQNFSYLNFLAYNYSAAYRWSYTPHLYGNVTASRDQTLNNFADFRGFNLRNVRTNIRTRADATYELDARWRVLGGLTVSSLGNSEPLIQEPDYRDKAVDAGVRYVLPTGSSAGYTFRSTDGTYLNNRTLPSPGFYDTGFTQTDSSLLATWVVSPDTSANFRAGYRSRRHPNYPQRDFSGMTGAAQFTWSITGKSAITAGWTRDLGTYETGISNFTRIDRFSIGPTWAISPKTTVRLSLERESQDFLGTPFGFAPLQRHDVTRNASVSIGWQALHSLLLNASLQNARRSSNLPGLDYTSNMINLTAQFTY